MKHSPLDVMISVFDAETSALGAAHRRSRQFSGNIGDCSVGITPQMCNRVTNHGDMGTFFKPARLRLSIQLFQ